MFASFTISAILICKAKKSFVNKIENFDTEKSKCCEQQNQINFVNNLKENASKCDPKVCANGSLTQVAKETDSLKITKSSIRDNAVEQNHQIDTNQYCSMRVYQLEATSIMENTKSFEALENKPNTHICEVKGQLKVFESLQTSNMEDKTNSVKKSELHLSTKVQSSIPSLIVHQV